MSGGLGSACTDEDTKLPKSKESETQNLTMNSTLPPKPTKTHRGILSFRQLNALAIAIVLAATGMVSAQDITFVLLSVFYMIFLSKFAFPLSPPSVENQPIFSPAQNKILAVYVTVGALVGLLLPIVYIFHGIYEGDKQGIKAAVPHVFLLSSQVFMEGFAFSNRFSIPIRVFVPVFYNAMRILTIMDWLKVEIFEENEAFGGGSEWRVYVGRGLGVGNMLFWSFNLFGFLLPVYLPRAFKRYYGAKEGKD